MKHITRKILYIFYDIRVYVENYIWEIYSIIGRFIPYSLLILLNATMFMNIFYPTVFTDTRQFSSINVIITQKSKGKNKSLHLSQKTIIRVTADRESGYTLQYIGIGDDLNRTPIARHQDQKLMNRVSWNLKAPVSSRKA